MIRYFVFTNKDFAVNIDVNDRRFFVIENTQPPLTKDEVDAIVDAMQDPGAIRSFYDWLKAEDVEDFNFRENRPITQYQEDLKEASLPLEHRFLGELAHHPDRKEKMFVKDLYAMFCAFRIANGYKEGDGCKQSTFSLNLNKYTLEPNSGITRAENGNIRIDGLKLKGYEFNFELLNTRFNESGVEIPEIELMEPLIPSKPILVDEQAVEEEEEYIIPRLLRKA